MDKKILLLIVAGVFLAQPVFASGATLSVLPLSGSHNVAAPFTVSVQLDPAGSQVCVVKGTLVFDDLSCQSIQVASGLMAQVSPTCQSPSFTLGIPKCASSVANLLTVAVAGKQAGKANFSVSGVKIIGSGTDVAFTQQPGMFDITAVVVQPKLSVEQNNSPVVAAAPNGEQQNSEGAQTAEQTELEQQAVDVTGQQEQLAVEQNVIPVESGTASLADALGNLFNLPVLIAIGAIILAVIIFWFFGKNRFFTKKNP